MRGGGADAARELVVRCAGQGEPARFVGLGELPTELPPEEDGYWADRCLDGGWLAAFLTDPASEVHRRGVTVIGARIAGGLDLEGAELPGWLRLLGCQFGDEMVDLAEVRARSVGLGRSSCGKLRADGIRLAGDLYLDDGFTSLGAAWVPDAVIGGSLVCSGGRFLGRKGPALWLAGISPAQRGADQLTAVDRAVPGPGASGCCPSRNASGLHSSCSTSSRLRISESSQARAPAGRTGAHGS